MNKGIYKLRLGQKIDKSIKFQCELRNININKYHCVNKEEFITFDTDLFCKVKFQIYICHKSNINIQKTMDKMDRKKLVIYV